MGKKVYIGGKPDKYKTALAPSNVQEELDAIQADIDAAQNANGVAQLRPIFQSMLARQKRILTYLAALYRNGAEL